MRVVRETAVLREPDGSAERVTTVLLGEEVSVAEVRDGWARVTAHAQPTHLDAGGYPGWVRPEALADDAPLAVARSFLGTPYLWGGMSRDGIDCSGLVHLAFRLVGFRVPRDAADQHRFAEPVESAAPGDVYFFRREGGSVSHVGFVTADGMLHAHPEQGVVEEQLDSLPPERHASMLGAFRLSR